MPEGKGKTRIVKKKKKQGGLKLRRKGKAHTNGAD